MRLIAESNATGPMLESVLEPEEHLPSAQRLHGTRVAQCTPMKTLAFAVTGALLGILIASLIVPPALSWYTAPGGLPQGTQIQALVQIPDVIAYATGRLIRGQAIGAVIGAAIGSVVSVLMGRRRVAVAA